MKKIAMLGDLHGNLTATLAMEKALKDYHVDEIWFPVSYTHLTLPTT